MQFLTPTTYYVYTYAFPDGTIFYIGKGTRGRIDEHEREASYGCQCQKCEIIRSIWISGKPVQKRIIYETLDELDALEQELALIRSHAGPHLTNIKSNPHRAKNLQSSNNTSISDEVFQDQTVDQGRLVDKIIHQPVRLRIMAALVALDTETQVGLDYLKDLLELTDGNLGTHLRKLEETGYITVMKSFVNKKPHTYVEATMSGRQAFTEHVAGLGAILNGNGRVG